jgi:hypothetical protein
MAASEARASSRKSVRASLRGAALGMLVELPALAAAFASAGAGHGDYVAARALFPLPMLLAVVEGRIGWFSGSLALLQLPLYGALLGWSLRRGTPILPILLALLHLAAAVACFSGMIFDFR